MRSAEALYIGAVDSGRHGCVFPKIGIEREKNMSKI